MDTTPVYSVRLSDTERRTLQNFEHALDYTFSEEDLQFLETNGYLVLRGIIPAEDIDQLVQEALSYVRKTGINIQDPSTWHLMPQGLGVFDIWHTPTYNRLRQHPLLYSVFAQLLKTGNLTVSVDRISLKAPCVDEQQAAQHADTNANLRLHTDLNFWHADPQQPVYQGGLCLQDCPVGGGGFFCVPGFHRPEVIEQYKQRVESGEYGHPGSVKPPPRITFCRFWDQHLANAEKVEVPMNKGDFVIWNNNLPHNGGRNSLLMPWPADQAKNRLKNWRMHAFIMFVPLDGPFTNPDNLEFYTQYQKETRDAILSGGTPVHFATMNSTEDSGGKEIPGGFTKVNPADLTELGKRLLGNPNSSDARGKSTFRPKS
ncbi:uncharacterized protein LOC129585502 [Paramacrobiotus metropolitanus]|uniref:uncharacterized protein LOC129585502 n=1 Tax=Paramacrobiotus metropolitanus TaxID=2943436 RepID=UPI002445AD0A|nr:uncharacterized protein LOC129585502 [Paramacrobiotus metropolitanus]